MLVKIGNTLEMLNTVEKHERVARRFYVHISSPLADLPFSSLVPLKMVSIVFPGVAVPTLDSTMSQVEKAQLVLDAIHRWQRLSIPALICGSITGDSSSAARGGDVERRPAPGRGEKRGGLMM